MSMAMCPVWQWVLACCAYVHDVRRLHAIHLRLKLAASGGTAAVANPGVGVVRLEDLECQLAGAAVKLRLCRVAATLDMRMTAGLAKPAGNRPRQIACALASLQPVAVCVARSVLS